jgi:hypothetical protein
MTACVPIEKLAQPAALDAAEREHVAACPRCASLRAEYEAFVAGDAGGVTRSELAAAEDALGALVERELPVAAARRAIAAARARRPWWQGASARMALAAAGLLVVAGTFVALRDRPRQAPLLRGAPATSLAVVAEPGAKGLVLRWGARADADAYRVEIVSAELQPLATFGPVRAPSFTLARGAVAGAAPGAEAWCRIVALHAGAPVGESEPLPIRLP